MIASVTFEYKGNEQSIDDFLKAIIISYAKEQGYID